jgi:hypothetical protein
MEKLTDEQLRVLGTAIGAEIVKTFCSKQEYWYGSKGWLSKIATVFAEGLANQLTANIRLDEHVFVRIGKKILGKD